MATEKLKYTEAQLAKKAEVERRVGRPCYLIKVGDLEVIFGEPNDDDIDIFMTEVAGGDKTRGQGILGLARRNVVDPPVDRNKDPDAREVFKSKPGALVPMANAYAEACGVTADAYLGK